MSISNGSNDWNEHGEDNRLISPKNLQEIIILKETHSPISNLQMRSRDTPDKPLKQLWDIRLKLLHVTDLKDLRQLRQEHGLFCAVSERPVSE